MSDLADFLLARIAEDERVVRYASVNARRPALQLDSDGYPVMDLHRVLAECEGEAADRRCARHDALPLLARRALCDS